MSPIEKNFILAQSFLEFNLTNIWWCLKWKMNKLNVKIRSTILPISTQTQMKIYINGHITTYDVNYVSKYNVYHFDSPHLTPKSLFICFQVFIKCSCYIDLSKDFKWTVNHSLECTIKIIHKITLNVNWTFAVHLNFLMFQWT